MRAVIQRVTEASVTVDNAIVGQIQRGFMVLLGVAEEDAQDDVIWIAGKIAGLRVFEDADGRARVGITCGVVAGRMITIGGSPAGTRSLQPGLN